MRRVLLILAAAFLAGALPAQAGDTGPKGAALAIGVVPFNSTRLLLDNHRPLVEHLRGDFGPGVELVTATSFRAFYEEAVKGAYDVAIMPAHMARLAQLDHGFVPLVRYSADVPGLVVAAANGPIANVGQLAGKAIAVPDRLSLTAITVLAGLAKVNLVPDRDFTLLEMPSFNSAVLAISRGDVQAAITTRPPFDQMPAEQRSNLRVVVDTGPFPSLIYIAHPRLSAPLRARLTDSLIRFDAAAAGRAFFEATRFGGIARVGSQDMTRLDPFVRETRRQLAQKPAP